MHREVEGISRRRLRWGFWCVALRSSCFSGLHRPKCSVNPGPRPPPLSRIGSQSSLSPGIPGKPASKAPRQCLFRRRSLPRIRSRAALKAHPSPPFPCGNQDPTRTRHPRRTPPAACLTAKPGVRAKAVESRPQLLPRISRTPLHRRQASRPAGPQRHRRLPTPPAHPRRRMRPCRLPPKAAKPFSRLLRG